MPDIHACSCLLLPPHVPAAAATGSGASWRVGCISGPHADPDFITPGFMDTFHSSPYKVGAGWDCMRAPFN